MDRDQVEAYLEGKTDDMNQEQANQISDITAREVLEFSDYNDIVFAIDRNTGYEAQEIENKFADKHGLLNDFLFEFLEGRKGNKLSKKQVKSVVKTLIRE